MNLLEQATQPHPKSYRIQIAAGDRFGKLSAVELNAPPGGGRRLWRCQCDCGEESQVAPYDLKSGRAKSCGCSHADNVKARRAESVEPEPVPGARFIALTKGLCAVVDEEDYARLAVRSWFAKWSEDSHSFYAASNGVAENGKPCTILMHREALHAPKGLLTDHIEPDLTLDNRKANLRLATHAESNRNRAIGRNNKSGYKGVYLDKATGKWRACIRVNGKTQNLGSCNTKEEAYAVYCEAAHRLHGQYARVA